MTRRAILQSVGEVKARRVILRELVISSVWSSENRDFLLSASPLIDLISAQMQKSLSGIVSMIQDGSGKFVWSRSEVV